MAKANVIYLYVWSGSALEARALVATRYVGAQIRSLPQRQFRQNSSAARIRLLQRLRGRATVFYFQSLADLKYGLVMQCIHFLHHCDETVLCDSTGHWRSLRTAGILKSAPRLLFAFVCDLGVVGCWWLYLKIRARGIKPVPFQVGALHSRVAYLMPTPENIGNSGGAMSHIRGFLDALQQEQINCRVFTGTALAQNAFLSEHVAAHIRLYFFWQAEKLSYNRTFVHKVTEKITTWAPSVFYQRHTRFSIAGTLLSQHLRVPLILEYNGPEAWIADHWDPTHFRGLLALCEDVTLRSAARIVVVSEALRADLLSRGFRADRILVNPNGVDGTVFSAGPQRASRRKELQVQPEEVVVGFVGSFSLWHGIEILQQAIAVLLSNPQPCRLRFVLMGDGLLLGQMRTALEAWENTGQVRFTGSLPPLKVVGYLDACDIVVSPHIPMPDGSRFFGSPTKLFEYMAMGKAIIASSLEQLAEVLTHDRTGWLVTPGDAQELTEAILTLARDPARRESLGAAARQAALEKHSWKQNVAIALQAQNTTAEKQVSGAGLGEASSTGMRA